tara:strand:- start:594 stop:1679 length:1086 start_codon:yes stop_codon:yes gene_type:complete
MGLNEKFFRSADEDEPFFNTVLHSGNSTGTTRQITGVGFQPDLVITKARNATQINSVYDSVRGVGNGVDSAGERMLATSLTNGQSDFDGRVNGYLSSFDLDGFTATKGTGAGRYYYNRSGYNYVNWCFKAGGAAVSNTDGDIPSNVSANVANGFSIVSYSGNSSFGQTIGHGLGVQPQMVIHKNLSNVRNWRTYVEPLGATKYINLDENAVAGTYGSFNNTAPTSTVFSTTNSVADRATNFNGDNYIAYCFHSVAGVSKVGSYTGNGSTTTGNTINIGFEASFIMIKKSSGASGSSSGWFMIDNKRNTSDPWNKYIFANNNAAEGTTTQSLTSVGATSFTVKSSGAAINLSGSDYIYYAIA